MKKRKEEEEEEEKRAAMRSSVHGQTCLFKCDHWQWNTQLDHSLFFMDNDKNALPVPIYACVHSTMSNIPIQHNVYIYIHRMCSSVCGYLTYARV